METYFPQLVIKIIREQELIVGPLAWSEARKVHGLEIIDEKMGKVNLSSDPKNTINKLVSQYERLFGKASHAVCHDAVQDLVAKMPSEQVPSSLR